VGPDQGHRNEPIRGNGTMKRVVGTQGQRIASGVDVIGHPHHDQVMGLVAERMAQNISGPQMQLGLIRRRRGPAALQEYPDGAGRDSGKIRARHTFGDLGPASAIQPEGRDPLRPSVLDKYEAGGTYPGAAHALHLHGGFGTGYPADGGQAWRRSRFETMGHSTVLSEAFDDHAS